MNPVHTKEDLLDEWHALEINSVWAKLNSAATGLAQEEAAKRLAQNGANAIPAEKSLSALRIFLNQFRSPLIYVLFFAGIVTILLKDYSNSIVIFLAVIINALVGFFQENKASRALSSLKSVLKNKATVLRSAKNKEISQEELVPGDVIILRPGEKVPADARLFESKDLKTSEATLTGEWLAVDKSVAMVGANSVLANRTNMVFMGTLVESGFAKAVVVGTGINTEVGKIAHLISVTKEEETPYQKKLIIFGKIAGGLVVFLSVIIFFAGLLKGESFIDIFTTSVALAVAAIPEGLPIAMTVVLALGMQRILKRNGLVRKLAAAESLGSTTIICVDKTGTLTEGKMEVSDILAVDSTEPGKKFALQVAMFCSEAYIENLDDQKEKWITRGRPTDRSLLDAAIKIGFNRQELERSSIVDRLEFSSQIKMSGCITKAENDNFFYLMGAPEKVLKFCKFRGSLEHAEPLAKGEFKKLEDEYQELTSQGLRILAIAVKKTTQEQIKLNDQELFGSLIFIGFIGLKDPLRNEVKDAILIARKAGLRPIILTGDHKLTAQAVAKELELDIPPERIIEGEELARISDEDFAKKVVSYDIYARLEPAQKLKIVEAWQKRGEVVAMTGDGVNDAPALKKADIGLALGSGSQVSHEVSDIVLLDDNFSTIVAAVEEGRGIIDNIRKSIIYLISDSFTEIFLILITLILNWPLPVLAGQILWINLIEDGLPTIALAFEPKEGDLMKRRPNPKKLPLLTGQMSFMIVTVAIITVMILVGFYYYLRTYTSYELAHIRTIMFASLALSTLFYVFACKTIKLNLWQTNLLSNRWLIFAFFTGFLALLAAVYIPILQVLLETRSLVFVDWLLVLILSVINLILIEIVKYFSIRHYEKN